MIAGPGLVVDASVAVKWHLRDERYAAEASILLRRFVGGGLQLHAPAFIRYEVAQSLIRASRDRRIAADVVAVELESFLALGIHSSHDADDLVASAQRIAEHTGASVYDAMYLAHAEALDIDLVTSDEQLLRQASGYPVSVRSLLHVARQL